LPKAPWVFATCQKMSFQKVSELFVTMELKKLNQLLVDFEAATNNEKSKSENPKFENSESDSEEEDEKGEKFGKKSKKGRRKKGER